MQLPAEQNLLGGWDSCVFHCSIYSYCLAQYPEHPVFWKDRLSEPQVNISWFPMAHGTCFSISIFFSRCIDEFHISSPKSHLCHLNQTSRLHLWLLSSHLLGHKRHSPCFWLSVIFYLGLAHRCWTWRVVLIFLSAPSSCLFILKREPSRNSIGLGQTELKFQSLSFM